MIGESGSGKSTIGKAIVGLEKITDGQILYEGKDVTSRSYRKKINYNQDVQMIFQDSMSSLDPKKRILDIIAEPIRNFEKLTPKEEKEKVFKLLDIVGLNESAIYKYPFEFSGGQRQRIGVARAVACNPRLIVADEPVSALDLSVQAQVLNYMKLIQQEFNLSYIFISHDLGVVRHMCDYTYIMHNGKFVETGNRDELYSDPQHIYTKRLIAAIPQIDPSIRKELRDTRQAIEKKFDEQKNVYYDENGSVYDLEKYKDSHYVAARKGEI